MFPPPVSFGYGAPPRAYKLWVQPERVSLKEILCFQCRRQLVLRAADSSCAVLIKLSSSFPALLCPVICFCSPESWNGWSEHLSLCHQLSVIQLLVCGTNSLLQLLFSQEGIWRKCLWINCVLIPGGCLHHFHSTPVSPCLIFVSICSRIYKTVAAAQQRVTAWLNSLNLQLPCL